MVLSRVNILQLSLALMILGVGLNSEQLLGVFDFKGWYVGWIISIPFLVRYYRLNPSLLLFILLLAIPSTIALAEGLYSSGKAIFTFAFFIFLLSYARALVKAVGHEAIIAIYAKVGAVHAVFIIFNQLTYLASPDLSFLIFGATESVSFLTRANGLFLEPSEAAFYLVPALVYYFVRREISLFFLIFVAMIATFSSLTYIAIALSFLFAVYIRKASFVNLLLLIFFGLIILAAAVVSPQIVDRIDSISSVLDATELDFNDYNSSIATILMNSIVAKDSFFGSNFIGIGFGNFEYGFNQYASEYFPVGYTGEGLFWNRNTGGSLLIRVIAELGFVGVMILVYISYRLLRSYYSLRESSMNRLLGNNSYQAYVISAIVIFTVCLLRKDSLTNVHLFIFLVGALMLRRGYSGGKVEASRLSGSGGGVSLRR